MRDAVPAHETINELLQELTPRGRQEFKDGVIELLSKPKEDHANTINHAIRKSTYTRLFGSRFADSSFETYHLEPYNTAQKHAFNICKAYAEHIDQMQNEDKNTLILAGVSGTGKNHLAYSIAKVALKKKMQVVIKPFLHIMQEIKQSYQNKGLSEREILNEYIACDLLIVEEIGVSFETHAEKVYLFDLLDGRYKYAKPTIIITNFTDREFRAFVDFDGKHRIWDRMNQTAVVVPFTWKSYRGSNATINRVENS
jgi:DNA replication protein DnaC